MSERQTSKCQDRNSIIISNKKSRKPLQKSCFFLPRLNQNVPDQPNRFLRLLIIRFLLFRPLDGIFFCHFIAPLIENIFVKYNHQIVLHFYRKRTAVQVISSLDTAVIPFTAYYVFDTDPFVDTHWIRQASDPTNRKSPPVLHKHHVYKLVSFLRSISPPTGLLLVKHLPVCSIVIHFHGKNSGNLIHTVNNDIHIRVLLDTQTFT